MDKAVCLYVADQQKINRSVIASFPVFMVNMFGRFKRSADYLFNLISVFVNVLSIPIDEVVAIFKYRHCFVLLIYSSSNWHIYSFEALNNHRVYLP